MDISRPFYSFVLPMHLRKIMTIEKNHQSERLLRQAVKPALLAGSNIICRVRLETHFLKGPHQVPSYPTVLLQSRPWHITSWKVVRSSRSRYPFHEGLFSAVAPEADPD